MKVSALLAAFSAVQLLSSAVSFTPKKPNMSISSSKRDSSLKMALTLYGSQGSRSPLCNWAAYELGLELEMGDLSRNPHPFGQIPCLVDDDGDATIFESGAILNYLNSASETSLTKKQQAAVLSWNAWANASLDPICFLETPEGKVYDTGLKQPNRRIDKLNDILGKQQFLVEGGFTTADVAVASYLLYVLQFFPGVDLSRWPHVVRYMRECAQRQAYAKAFGDNVQNILVQALDDMGQSKKLFGMF
mmetsp:Transcript_20329/g.24434  ORF Transcript_20329/g.24434 Transcript_20329/m.24434 type:complete len:247 (+) Transcript_20329:59-799(+)